MRRIHSLSRRDLLGITAGLTSASWLWGQDAQLPVVLKVTVTGGTRYINGLKPADFCVLEDSIPQRIYAFAEGSNPPMLLNDDGTTRPLLEGELLGRYQQVIESSREDLDNSYILLYRPDPSNRNDGFREINIEIVPDVAKKWRVRHTAGYRPERR